MSTLLDVLAWTAQIVVSITAGFVLLTFVITMYERRFEILQARFKGGEGEGGSGRTSIGTGKILLAGLTEFLATLALVALSPLLKRRFDPAPPGGDRNLPILLVHGYCHNQSGWVYFRKRFKEARLGPVYSLNLAPPFASIETLAQRVARKAERIRAETGVSELRLIGHSMGGVVSSYYAEYLAPEGTVTDVITMGSPLRGTRLAAMGYGPNAISMTPNSPLIAELGQRILQNDKVRYRFLGSELDNMIHPSRSAYLGDDPAQRRMFDDCGHASLLLRPEAARQAIEWLSDAANPSPAEASDVPA